MSFSNDPRKQAQEVMFWKKTAKGIHLNMFSIDIPVSNFDARKYLALHLDSQLSFDIHFKSILTTVNRAIGLLRNFGQVLPSIIS